MAILSNIFLCVCVCILMISHTTEVQGHCGGVEGKIEDMLQQRSKMEEVLHDAECGIKNAATAVKDAFSDGFQFLKDKLSVSSLRSDNDAYVNEQSGN